MLFRKLRLLFATRFCDNSYVLSGVFKVFSGTLHVALLCAYRRPRFETLNARERLLGFGMLYRRS